MSQQAHRASGLRCAAVCLSGGEIADVEELEGIRVLEAEDGSPLIEYLVKWKDGSPNTGMWSNRTRAYGESCGTKDACSAVLETTR